MIFSRRGAFSVFLGPKNTPGPTEGKEIRGQKGYAEHMADFLDAVRTRRTTTRAAAEIAHRSCALVHLGEIAFRTRGPPRLRSADGKVRRLRRSQSDARKELSRAVLD